MFQRLAMQLPPWARPDTPVIRYVMGTQSPFSRRAWLTQLVAALVALVVAAVVITLTAPEMGQSLSERVMTIVFWPTVLAQAALSVAALVYTSSAISAEKRRQNWDNLRATGNGAALALRAQWSAAVFYRFSGLMTAILLVRVLLVGLIVYDLTAFRGEYLNYLIGAVIPEVPILAGVVLLALTMTACFILPLTGLGLDAALGVLLSTLVSGRVFVALAQIVFGVLRFVITFGLIALLVYATDPTLNVSEGVRGLAMLGMGAFGDLGLRYLHLAFLGELWATVPYAVLIGAALLVVAFMQALLTDGLLAWSVRRAEKKE